MKKFIAVLLVLATVLAMTTVAFAYKEKEVDPDTHRMYFKKSAWGYEKVTNNYGKNKKVAIKKGSTACAYAVKGDWYKIAVPGKKKYTTDYFWFNKKYLRKAKDDELKGIIFSSGGSNRSHEQGSDTLKTLNFTIKTSGKVNMRKTASLAGGRIISIPKGKKVKLTGKLGMDSRNIVFVQVKYKGKTGYISMEYVREADQKKLLNKGGVGAWLSDFYSLYFAGEESGTEDEDAYAEEEASEEVQE